MCQKVIKKDYFKHPTMAEGKKGVKADLFDHLLDGQGASKGNLLSGQEGWKEARAPL